MSKNRYSSTWRSDNGLIEDVVEAYGVGYRETLSSVREKRKPRPAGAHPDLKQLLKGPVVSVELLKAYERGQRDAKEQLGVK